MPEIGIHSTQPNGEDKMRPNHQSGPYEKRLFSANSSKNGMRTWGNQKTGYTGGVAPKFHNSGEGDQTQPSPLQPLPANVRPPRSPILPARTNWRQCPGTPPRHTNNYQPQSAPQSQREQTNWVNLPVRITKTYEGKNHFLKVIACVEMEKERMAFKNPQHPRQSLTLDCTQLGLGRQPRNPVLFIEFQPKDILSYARLPEEEVAPHPYLRAYEQLCKWVGYSLSVNGKLSVDEQGRMVLKATSIGNVELKERQHREAVRSADVAVRSSMGCNFKMPVKLNAADLQKDMMYNSYFLVRLWQKRPKDSTVTFEEVTNRWYECLSSEVRDFLPRSGDKFQKYIVGVELVKDWAHDRTMISNGIVLTRNQYLTTVVESICTELPKKLELPGGEINFTFNRETKTILPLMGETLRTECSEEINLHLQDGEAESATYHGLMNGSDRVLYSIPHMPTKEDLHGGDRIFEAHWVGMLTVVEGCPDYAGLQLHRRAKDSLTGEPHNQPYGELDLGKIETDRIDSAVDLLSQPPSPSAPSTTTA